MKDPKRIVADAYDQIGERYLEWRARQPRQEELARWLNLVHDYVKPGAHVLDVGCGAGIQLTRALTETFDVTGVDISARQVSSKSNLSRVQGNLEGLLSLRYGHQLQQGIPKGLSTDSRSVTKY